MLHANSYVQLRQSIRRHTMLSAGLAVGLASQPASAYTYGSVVSDSCHESLALDALRTARALPELSAAAAAPPESDDDRLLREGLPFELPDDMHDPAAVALALGVRDNDLKGTHETDLERLPAVHSDPNAQKEHCLRRPEHDFEEGSRAALAECVAYIREQAMYAVREGLDASGRPSERRAGIAVSLPYAGTVHVEVPLFHLQMGMALHALQDSFTHTFRAPVEVEEAFAPPFASLALQDSFRHAFRAPIDRNEAFALPFDLTLAPTERTRVTVVLNWVEFAEERLDERRDGPSHMTELDECNAGDALRDHRRLEAISASVDLLRAALAPELDDQGKQAAIDAVLSGYLDFQPGCSLENRWCDAPETALRSSGGCSCALTGAGGDGAAGLGLVALALAGSRLRCAGRRRARKRYALAAAAAMLASPTIARAEDITERAVGKADSAEAERAVGKADSAEAERAEEPPRSPFGFATHFGGAVDNLALAGSLGLRGRPHERWVLGIDAEWNPWLSLESERFSYGTFNGYFTVIRRWPIDAPVGLRTSVHLGVSTLLFDVPGARLGSVGPYLGASALGVEVPIDRQWTFLIDPADVALAVPHVTGVPLLYPQYRISIGFQYGG